MYWYYLSLSTSTLFVRDDVSTRSVLVLRERNWYYHDPTRENLFMYWYSFSRLLVLSFFAPTDMFCSVHVLPKTLGNTKRMCEQRHMRENVLESIDCQLNVGVTWWSLESKRRRMQTSKKVDEPAPVDPFGKFLKQKKKEAVHVSARARTEDLSRVRRTW